MEINGKDYKVKYNLRAMFVFEEITGKAFQIETLLDNYIFIYSCIISVKDNPEIDFNEFIDYCSEHDEVIEEFTEIIKTETQKRELMNKKKVMENS